MTPKKMEAKREELLQICADGTKIAGVFEMLDDPPTVIQQLRKACMAICKLHLGFRPCKKRASQLAVAAHDPDGGNAPNRFIREGAGQRVPPVGPGLPMDSNPTRIPPTH